MASRKPYTGLARKLILGIDVGTTYSGVSYTILEPGQIPDIKGVTRFPAQEHVGGDSKIPSVLLYDEVGNARAIGAETLQEQLIEQAEDEGWIKIEWFKLHLRPKRLDTSHIQPLPLPPNKSIVGVYADFLRYLFSCVKTYIEETHANGESLWDSIKSSIEYVITHPNGWEGSQRAYLRRAAVEAGLVSDIAEGLKLVQFLTEGEASLHFCVQNGLGTDIGLTGHGVIIVDAGGGTIDTSAFAAISANSYEEISAAQCCFQGSVFVTRRATTFLKDKFKSRFTEDVPNMAMAFDRTTKLRFRSAEEPAFIKFGGLRDKDAALNIRAGQLTLEGTEVASFFRPSIDAMIQAILTQHKNSHKPISNVFLVGGFAASDFVFSTLQNALQPLDIIINRPDGHVNKAVADGAVSFYLDRLVSLRVARFDYGIKCNTPYNPVSMVSRAHLVYKNLKGKSMVPNSFDVILPKDTQVSETQSFSRPFHRLSTDTSLLNQCSEEILSYHGNMNPSPERVDVDLAGFTTHCRVTADLTSVPKPLCRGPTKKKKHYEIYYNVNITFGPTEMSAYLTWDENGVKNSGPAQVIYDDADDEHRT